jgi:hypothetical protein
MKKLLLFIVALLASQANATIISADFTAKSDAPYCDTCVWRQGPLVAEALGRAVDASVELDAGATISNTSGWLGGIVYIDLDPVAKTLTLLAQDQFDYQTFSATISNIHFSGSEMITGLQLISDNLTVDIATLPTLSFTGNSLQIDYSQPDWFYFNGPDGKAVFQITTEVTPPGTSLPEPATTGLFGLGLAGLLGMRRRVRA